MSADEGWRDGVSMPFHKLAATCWPSRGKVMFSLLRNWQKQHAHFRATEGALHDEAKYKTRDLGNMLSDDFNYLFLVFAAPIIRESERLNALFQSENEDHEAPMKDSDLHFRSLHARIHDKNGKKLSLSQVDFGAKVLSEAERLSRNHSRTKEFAAIKQRCQDMLTEAMNKRHFVGIFWHKPRRADFVRPRLVGLAVVLPGLLVPLDNGIDSALGVLQEPHDVGLAVSRAMQFEDCRSTSLLHRNGECCDQVRYTKRITKSSRICPNNQ